MGCEKSSAMRSGSAPITFIKEAYFSPWAGPIKLRDGSLRSSASPSTMTTSIPCFVPSKASVIWGLRCTLRIFRSPGLLKTRKVSPSHRNQTGTVCGRPSARTVVNQMVGSSRKRCSTCASMGCVDAELLSSVLLLPADMVIEAVYPSKTLLTVQVVCRLQSAACPLCQQSSERIHGSYGRTVADVSCGGRRVTLALTVRKFVCRTRDCPRKIFTERLPDLVQPYARMTNRLSEVLQSLGFATCGELGERLAPKLGMGASGPTLLRRMRAVCIPPPKSVRILGIDDWAWKKGQTYGIILVDLETRPIELLPDRSTETVEAWLRTHPEVEIVSRDRGGEYAAAARKGAPQAQQIVDRFHLLKNLRERLKELMDRKQSCLPEVEEQVSDAIPTKAQGIKDKRLHESAEPQGEPEVEKHYRTIPP